MKFEYEIASKDAVERGVGFQGTESPEQVAAIDQAIKDLSQRQRLTKTAINGAFLSLEYTHGEVAALQFIMKLEVELVQKKRLTIDKLPDK